MRHMRGQMMMPEATLLILALVFGVFLIALMVIITGSLGPLMEEICRQHPNWPWCNTTTSTINYQISRNSATALACAINSVAQGKRWYGSFIVGEGSNAETMSCSDVYTNSIDISGDGEDDDSTKEVSVYCTDPSNLGSTENEFTANLAAELLKCFESLDAGKTTVCGLFSTSTLPDGAEITEKDIRDWLKNNGGEAGKNLIGSGKDPDGNDYQDNLEWSVGSITNKHPTVHVIEIWSSKTNNAVKVVAGGQEAEEFVCTVNNFQLPQKVTGWEDYIRNYGDPEFLVYWNMFPIEENTWTYTSDWKTYALYFAVTIMPLGKVVSIGKQIASTVTKQGVRAVLKDTLRNAIYKRLVASSIKSVVIRGGVITGVHTIAKALEESSMAKFEIEPNTIVMKSPYEDKEKFTLVSEAEDMPVVQFWRKEIFTEGAHAHLVSPCSLGVFEIKKEYVECEYYIRKNDDGTIICQDASISDDEELLQCGVWDEEIDKKFPVPFYEKIDNSAKGDKKLFEYNDDETLKRIYIPWKSDSGMETTSLDSDKETAMAQITNALINCRTNNLINNQKTAECKWLSTENLGAVTITEQDIEEYFDSISNDYDSTFEWDLGTISQNSPRIIRVFSETCESGIINPFGITGRVHVASTAELVYLDDITCEKKEGDYDIYKASVYSSDEKKGSITFQCFMFSGNEYDNIQLKSENDNENRYVCEILQTEFGAIQDMLLGDNDARPRYVFVGDKDKKNFYIMVAHTYYELPSVDSSFTYIDDDLNGEWDTFNAKRYIGEQEDQVTVSNLENGDVNFLAMENCRTEAIALENFEDKEDYCFHQKSTTEVITKYLGYAVGIGALIYANIIMPGSGSLLAALKLNIVNGIITFLPGEISDWASEWPG